MKKQTVIPSQFNGQLTKSAMKDIIGGTAAPAPGGCVRCDDDRGYSSCWFTAGSGSSLCERVYPNSAGVYYSVSCSGCTMN